MKTKKQQIWKSISLLVFAFAASLFLFTNCSSDDDVYSSPDVTISEDGVVFENNEISFDQNANSKTIEINSNRDWKITKQTDADWIDIEPTSGAEGASNITIAVKSNKGAARKEYITIEASTARITIRINQASVDGIEFKNNTIAEIRTMYANSGEAEWTIAEPLQLKAVVTSDREGGNSTSLKNGFLQDEDGGAIAFRVSENSHQFDMGDELNLDLKGSIISEYAGALQIAFSTANAVVQATDVNVTPKELTIEEILSGGYDATLVKIKDVQFRDYENRPYYEGDATGLNRTLEDIYGKTIVARTAKYAKFKDKLIPKGKGNIVGIMSVFNGTWQLTIRNLDDVSEMSNDESTRFTPDSETPPVTPGNNDGTKEKPYTVAEAIAKQGSGTDVWVKAFIVGSSNSDPSYVPQFSKENPSGTNIIIADSKNEGNADKVLAVQLAWDGDARGALNLKANPGMYKAAVLLKGNLVKYFGVAGIKEVKEFEVVTAGEGGTTPDPDPDPETPEGYIMFEALAGTLGTFTEFSVAGESTWYGDEFAGDKYAKISGFDGSTNTANANEDWLISPAIDLSKVSTAKLSFSHLVGHPTGNEPTILTVWVSSNYATGNPNGATWSKITITYPPKHPTSNFTDWQEVAVSIPSSMIGKTGVRIAFKYTSTNSEAPTWEVMKVGVK